MKIQLSDPHYTREDALLIPMMYHFYRKYLGKVDAHLQNSHEMPAEIILEGDHFLRFLAKTVLLRQNAQIFFNCSCAEDWPGLMRMHSRKI